MGRFNLEGARFLSVGDKKKLAAELARKEKDHLKRLARKEFEKIIQVRKQLQEDILREERLILLQQRGRREELFIKKREKCRKVRDLQNGRWYSSKKRLEISRERKGMAFSTDLLSDRLKSIALQWSDEEELHLQRKMNRIRRDFIKGRGNVTVENVLHFDKRWNVLYTPSGAVVVQEKRSSKRQ